jgi:hypothetical protein
MNERLDSELTHTFEEVWRIGRRYDELVVKNGTKFENRTPMPLGCTIVNKRFFANSVSLMHKTMLLSYCYLWFLLERYVEPRYDISGG